MSTKAEKERSHAIIVALAARFPAAFSLVPGEIRPLKDDLLGDLIVAFRLRRDDIRAVQRALQYYRHWPEYLTAVAMGKKKRDLRGHRVEQTSREERDKARSELLKLGRWSDRLEQSYQARLYGLDSPEPSGQQ